MQQQQQHGAGASTAAASLPAGAQMNLAVLAKKPTDPGVIGMEAFRAAAPPVKEASRMKSSFGAETPEQKAAKAQLVADGRARMNDTYALLRHAVRYAVMGALLQLVVKSLLEKMLPAKAARAASLLAVLAAFIKTFGPSKRVVPPMDGIQDLPFVGALLQLAINRSRLHNFVLEKIRLLGFVSAEARLPGSSLVMLMDPRDREYVLKTNWRNYLKNREGDMGNFELVLGEILGRGIFSTDGLEWQDSRKIASHLFSGNGLKNQMEAVFNAHAAHIVDMFEKVAAEGGVVDIQEIFQCVVFDAFCEIAFGIYPDATAAAFGGKKPQFLLSFDYAQNYCSERVAMAPVEWHLKKIFSAVTGMGPDSELQRHLQIIDDYVYKVVRDRLRENAMGKNDLLSLYINYARETGQSHMLEEVYLRDTIVNFMIAGRDTTSCTLTNMCRYLSENPAVVEKIRATTLKNVNTSDHISWEQAGQLHLIHAVFNETIRMAPPVGDDFRITIEDDVLPSGLEMPAGARMFIANVSIGRDPKLWSNPDTFNPERWMSYDEQGVAQKVRRPDEYILPVFWAGPRLCLGKDMARFESTVFCAKIFSKLNIISEPGQAVGNDFVMSPVIFYTKGWHVRFAPVAANN